nr:unnamed protein product [Callosobruchus analis]
MPVTCIVVSCRSRSERDRVIFFCIPIVRRRSLTNLSLKRRESWIAAIKRQDLTESKLKYQRVCSKHFITDYCILILFHIFLFYQQKDVSLQSEVIGDFEEELSGISLQTDLTMEEFSLKFSQLKLEKRIEVSPFGLLENQDNIHKWKYYTGFEYHFVHGVIFLPIADYITTTFTTKLSSFNQVLLTLIKLHPGLHFKDLAYRFSISPTTASTYFATLCIRDLQPLLSGQMPLLAKKSYNCALKKLFMIKQQ